MKRSTFTALVTAFREDESVDFSSIEKQARRQIAAGNDLFICGTNGDFSSLTFAERVKVVETCAKVADGRARLIANAGFPSTYETSLLAKEYAKLGVEAVAAITPYFIACTQEGLYRHYATIADAVSVPLYIYEIPARTGNSIDVSTVARLARHGNVKGIKDSSGKTERLDGLADVCADNPGFEFYNGTDSLILYGLQKGAAGCVSGLANVAPEWVRAIASAFESGDKEAAEAAQKKVNGLRERLYAFGYPPAMVKRALFLKDSSVGNNRLPALVPDKATDDAIVALLADLGL
ncbi:MAG: dihydrodipicolinate synthase family protein [Rectinemataceae bacterium]|nr:dihydrodipicolinate synthase family protein [Rectinemataceae bacterium]